jgi:multimeric flavodoxin WrbA
MKRVTAFVGSAHEEGNTYKAVRQLMDDLQSFGDVDGEIVDLSQYRLETCRGCKTCFNKGEEHCPLNDDRDLLFAKIAASDGVVFASPTYVFQVSGWMKVFLDRFGFACHRPRFFGKTFTSIVTQGFVGGRSARRYLDFVAPVLGFNRCKGVCLTGLDPMTEKEERRTRKAIARLSRRFHDHLNRPTHPVPSLLKLGMFRFSRKTVQRGLTEASRDYTWYRDQGWFESDYYYPVRLGPLKKAAGRLFDAVGTLVATTR